MNVRKKKLKNNIIQLHTSIEKMDPKKDAKNLAEQRMEATPGNEEEDSSLFWAHQSDMDSGSDRSSENQYFDSEEDEDGGLQQQDAEKKEVQSEIVEKEQEVMEKNACQKIDQQLESFQEERNEKQQTKPQEQNKQEKHKRESQQKGNQQKQYSREEEGSQEDQHEQKKDEEEDNWDEEQKKEKIEALQEKSQIFQVKEGEKNERRGRRNERPLRGGFQLKKLEVDTKFIYAIYYLFWQEVKQFMPAREGIIKCDPREERRFINIYYHDKKVCDQVVDKIETLIQESIDVIQVDKLVGECGIQFSRKYRQKLKKNKMLIFSMRIHKDSTSYFICGNQKPSELLREANLLKNKNVNFTWFYMYAYPDSRSYRKILSNFFELPEIKELIAEKFSAKEIEVACSTHSIQCSHSFQKKKDKIFCVLTFHGKKKVAIHQELENVLRGFISQNYWLYCFSFLREKREIRSSKWAPKIEDTKIFFIDEMNTSLPISYMFIIVKKAALNEARPKIIEQVEKMKKVKINGRRFFDSFEPSESERHKKMRCSRFPIFKPYSKSVWVLKDQVFDWKSELQFI